MATQDAASRLYFFLSYAREDDPEPIRRLFSDLSSYVRDYAGEATGADVGFLDVRTPWGAVWSDRLARGLGECSVFVALVSPRYVKSEYCGKEWAVFDGRRRAAEANDHRDPEALLPVQWIIFPRAPQHRVIADLQYNHDQMPEAYGQKGLRQLLRLRKYENEYEESVEYLAQQIVAIAERDRVPPLREVPELDAVQSVFHPVPAPVEQPPAARPSDAIPAQVCFVVAALDKSTASMINRDRRFYGEVPAAWSPYLQERPLGTFASEIAKKNDFGSVVTDIDNLPAELGAGSRRHDLVVFLIDLWFTRAERGPQRLQNYDTSDSDVATRDGSRLPMTGLMVPVSANDEQTESQAGPLDQRLRQSMPNRMSGPDTVLRRTSVVNRHSFDGDLQAMLEHARNHAFTVRSPVHRPPGHYGERPILQGP